MLASVAAIYTNFKQGTYMMKKMKCFLVLLNAAALSVSFQAIADDDIIGYVVDSSGKIVHDNYGGCVKTISWKESLALPQCEGKAPDSDGDGVSDDADRCKGTPANAKVDVNGCELDKDGDGVVDSKDKCPATPRGAAVDINGCLSDMDKDGIADYLDKCPGTLTGVKVDKNGCKLKVIIELKGVNFKTGSAKLTSESSTVLDEMSMLLKRYPDLNVEIAGHTDNTGSRRYNQSLSQKRAESVRQYLIDKGVTGENLTAKGYGPDAPIADNATADGRSKNRRVELKLK